MKLTVTPAAVRCFTEEWDFQEGDRIRFFVRYCGSGRNPFSFGVIKDDTSGMALSSVQSHITFFMEESDIWFLNGQDLTVDYRDEEIVFQL